MILLHIYTSYASFQKLSHKMKIFIIFILFSNFINAQNKFDSLTSKTKNLEWMRTLENKSEQIKLIIEKIKTDSIIPKNLTGIKLKIRDGEFNPDKCKILNFLENNKHMILLDLNLHQNFSIILVSIHAH